MRLKNGTAARTLSSLGVLALLAACGGAHQPEAGHALAPEAAEELDAEIFLSIATGGAGGAYYPYGAALASLLTSELGHVSATVETTGASVENLHLLQRGNVQLVHVQADAIFEAYYGTGPFDGHPTEVRTIIAKYPNYMQLVALKDSGIKTYDDLAGRRVSVGDAGSGVELTLTNIVAALGGSFDDFGKVDQLNYNDQTWAFRNNQIDVGNYQGALGLAALTDLSSTTEIQLLSFTPAQIDAVVAELPYHSPGIIPAGTYPGVTADVLVPTLWNFVAVSADMDRNLAYLITKTAYEHQAELIAGHPEAVYTTLENVTRAVVPYHPGSIDYFRDRGIDLPDNLYPDEWDG